MKAIYKLDVDDMTSIIAGHFKVDKNDVTIKTEKGQCWIWYDRT